MALCVAVCARRLPEGFRTGCAQLGTVGESRELSNFGDRFLRIEKEVAGVVGAHLGEDRFGAGVQFLLKEPFHQTPVYAAGACNVLDADRGREVRLYVAKDPMQRFMVSMEGVGRSTRSDAGWRNQNGVCGGLASD